MIDYIELCKCIGVRSFDTEQHKVTAESDIQFMYIVFHVIILDIDNCTMQFTLFSRIFCRIKVLPKTDAMS